MPKQNYGLCLALLLAGCSSQPAAHQFENSRTFAMPKAAVWQDVTTWLAGQPMTVGKADEASGQIIADVRYPLSGGPADCGYDDSSPALERRGQITVSVRPVDAANTTVTVNAGFMEYRRSGWDLSTIMAQCKSTGGLESELLAAIN